MFSKQKIFIHQGKVTNSKLGYNSNKRYFKGRFFRLSRKGLRKIFLFPRKDSKQHIKLYLKKNNHLITKDSLKTTKSLYFQDKRFLFTEKSFKAAKLAMFPK